MSSTGIRARPDRDKMTSENMLLSDQQFIQRMKVFNSESPATGFVGTGTAGGTAPNGGSFLQDATAAVTGAFGLAQASIDLISETLAVSIQDFDEHWTSFAEVTNAVTDDILDLIDGGDYSGQILKIRIPDAVTEMVIHNANNVVNTTGNILMAGVEDLRVSGGEIVEFIYDIFTTPQTGAQSRLKAGTLSGVWRLASGASAPASTAALATLGRVVDQDVSTSAPAIVIIIFDDNDFFGDLTKITATGTAGVFKLLAGNLYRASADTATQAQVTGGGTEVFMKYQFSDTETGTFTDTLPGIVSEESTVSAQIVVGNPDFSTQSHNVSLINAENQDVYVRLVADIVVGQLITYIEAASSGLLETFGAGGSGGGSGGGGTGLTNPLEENLNLNGYNFLMDIDGDTFWKNERDNLADDWTQLLVGGAIGLNISNRAGNQWVRSGFNLEPNGSTVTLGSEDDPWSEAYIDDFIDFDGVSLPPTPSSTQGRIFWDDSTKSFHQLDDAGTNTDLVGSASDVAQWATFPAVQDVIPNGTGILLGSTTADQQWGGLFMDPSTSIFWETTLGLFTDTRIQGTTGGFNLNVPSGGSYSLKIDNTEEFKVSVGSVSINTPTLDFNDSAAAIEGLHDLNFFDDASIINVSTIPGLGGEHLVYDISGTTPGHLFTVQGQEYIRIANDGDRTVDFRPDPDNVDVPTGIKNIRELRFLGVASPAISPGLAMITANTGADMFLNIADNRELSIFSNGNKRHEFRDVSYTMEGEVGFTFAMNPTVGNPFTILKSSTNPVLLTCDDDITLQNGSQSQITNLFGFLNGANTVPAELDFSGRNSVGATTRYAKILSRIDDNSSGAQTGDLELYAYRTGTEREMITLKGKDPIRSSGVIYIRNNMEFLSQAADANFLFLDEALVGRNARSTNPGTTFGNDSIMWLEDSGGVVALKIRFANNVTKTIADDT